MNLKELKKEIPYKWRVQSFSKNNPSASCVAYIDARDVMDLLDEVVGEGNWQDDYRLIDGKLFAGVGIRTSSVFIDQDGKCMDSGWVWKWDTGTESQTEKEKGQVSDSFKRACVKWGIGRFLYSLKVQYLKADAVKGEGQGKKQYPNVIDDKGNLVWDITAHINKIGVK